MNLLNETFGHIDEKLIQRLFDNQIQESKTLDYKREINLKSNDDKRELLAEHNGRQQRESLDRQ
jgi:hypothetical protein